MPEKSPGRRWIPMLLGLVGLAIFGFWAFMSMTAPVLHPDPQAIPSVTEVAPPPQVAPRVEQARQIVRASLSEKNLPALSVAVGIGGDIVWAEGFGFADLKSSTTATPRHRFRIGTASTVLTSAAVGLLLEDGRLKLDTEIQSYVPEFPRKQRPITLRALMGHTAGVVSDGGDEGPLFTKHCERPAEALPQFAQRPLLFEPGTQYRYSNYGWILVSAAVEAVAAQPFLAYMRERVFDPLGMRDTLPDTPPEPDDDFPLINLVLEKVFDPRTRRARTPDSAKKPAPDRVTPYFPRFAANPRYGLHLMRPLDYSCYAGSSVFVSTPSDLVRFAMAIHGGKLLQPATVQLLQTPQRLVSGEDTGYGLGWDFETVTLAGKQARVTGHDGELLGGMSSSLLTLPEQGIAVSVLSNISYADTFSLAVKVADSFAQPASR
jgi:serine beta-lactamase-like protein LACTB, mitochondrial